MRVLIAHDGSAGADQALAIAEALDWPQGSMLRIVGVVEPFPIFVGSSMGGGSFLAAPELDAQIVSYHEERLTDLVQRVRRSGRDVAGVVLRGRPATVLVDDAARFRADLVLIGSRGHGPISSLFLGSVSGEVVDQATCPVLVARTNTASRVVFATDGSGPSADAARILAEWPIFADLPIHVVSVADVVRPWTSGIAPSMYVQVMAAYSEDLEQARTAHAEIADEAAGALRAAGRAADATARSGDAAGEIVAAAKSLHADLVVVGSRGRTGLTRVLLGSVARNVLYASNASVLVIHERAPKVVA